MINYSPVSVRTWSIMGANGVIGTAAMELPAINPQIMVLTADQCLNSGLTRFKNAYPDKFFNAGISEQNMILMAGGVAREGFNPFVTAQAPFMSMRALDQVRVTLGYMKLGVKILGLAAGFSQGEYGATHHCINDLAILRSVPNLVVLSPADCTMTVKMITELANSDQPVYVRLTGVTHNPIVYNAEPEFRIGGSKILREGKDVLVLATGTMVAQALKAAKILGEKGIEARVVDVYSIKPFDRTALELQGREKLIVTIEEHSVIGGLGEMVAESLATVGGGPILEIIGAEDNYIHANEYSELLKNSGLTADAIAQRILSKISK